MSVWGKATDPMSERELVVTRVYDAPARLVFRAWSEREHLMKWFGPETWPVTMCEVDFRVGGRYRMAMTGPNGESGEPFGGQYHEIVTDKKIVMDDAFEKPGAPPMLWTVTFNESDGKTTQRIHILFWSTAMRDEYVGYGIEAGLGSALDQLTAVVDGLKVSVQR